jgi:hypothetical protein
MKLKLKLILTLESLKGFCLGSWWRTLGRSKTRSFWFSWYCSSETRTELSGSLCCLCYISIQNLERLSFDSLSEMIGSQFGRPLCSGLIAARYTPRLVKVIKIPSLLELHNSCTSFASDASSTFLVSQTSLLLFVTSCSLASIVLWPLRSQLWAQSSTPSTLQAFAWSSLFRRRYPLCL